MPALSVRAAATFTFLLALLAVFTPSLRADLVWTPGEGWRADGGVLGPLVGIDSGGRNALEMMNTARAAEESGSNSRALSLYESVAKKYPRSDFAAEALYRAAGLRLARKQYFSAFELYQKVVTLYPNTPHFNRIVGQQYSIATALIDGARNRWFGYIPGFTNRTKGLEYSESLLTTAPRSDYAPLVMMNIARGNQALGKNDEAIDALDRMINAYPQSLLAPDAYLRLAQAHAALVEGPAYDQASTKDAMTYYEDFTLQFPQDPNLPAAIKGLADMKEIFAQSKIQNGDFYFYKRDNYTAARVFYNEAITVYPDSPTAATARTRLAEVDAAEAKAKARGPVKKKWFFGLF